MREIVMPPDDWDERMQRRREWAACIGSVYGAISLMYAVAWVYGHFTWGWTL